MIQNDSSNGETVKEIRTRDRKEQEEKLRKMCEAKACELYGEDNIKNWNAQNKGLFYLPVMTEDDENTVEALAVLKPINRNILSYASTKISDDGLYAFLEQCIRECWIKGDERILNDDEFFIPAAMSFNKILEGRKASLLKR